MLLCGMAIGYRDVSSPLNNYKTNRRPVESWCKIIDK